MWPWNMASWHDRRCALNMLFLVIKKHVRTECGQERGLVVLSYKMSLIRGRAPRTQCVNDPLVSWSVSRGYEGNSHSTCTVAPRNRLTD